jgi:hypothetical protein
MRGLANWYIYTSNVNVSQEPKKGFVETKIQKASFKNQEEREFKCRTASRTSGCMELRAPGIETTARQVFMRRQRFSKLIN